jgi:hypothetical protein
MLSGLPPKGGSAERNPAFLLELHQMYEYQSPIQALLLRLVTHGHWPKYDETDDATGYVPLTATALSGLLQEHFGEVLAPRSIGSSIGKSSRSDNVINFARPWGAALGYYVPEESNLPEEYRIPEPEFEPAECNAEVETDETRAELDLILNAIAEQDAKIERTYRMVTEMYARFNLIYKARQFHSSRPQACGQ